MPKDLERDQINCSDSKILLHKLKILVNDCLNTLNADKPQNDQESLSPPVFSPVVFSVTPKGVLFFSFFLLVFLGLYPQHMEVPRLGVELELYPPVYTTATWRL